MVRPFDVDIENAVKDLFGSGLQIPYMRNARAVHQNAQRAACGGFPEDFVHAGQAGNIAAVRGGLLAPGNNFPGSRMGGLLIAIEDAHDRAILRKSLDDGLANATGAPGDDCNFGIKPKWMGFREWISQSAIPRFPGLSGSSADAASRC